MEKVPYIRQRKQGSGLIGGNTTSHANLTIPESILNDTPYPNIGSLGPAQNLTPEQVEKQRARGALKDNERAEKARDRLKNASKTGQGLIPSSSSSGQMDQDNRLHSQNVAFGPQQQVTRYHSRQGMPTYSAHGRPPYIPTMTATTSPVRPLHPHASWQQYQSKTGTGDPLPPGMSSLPQSLLVPNTQPMVQPVRPGVGHSWRPRQYNATSSTIQHSAIALPMSRPAGNVIHDRDQQNMHTNHLQGPVKQEAYRMRGAKDKITDTPRTDKPQRMKKRGRKLGT
ncbi:hypothetical protein BGZ82_005721 [Podila clonocystis]|nr:hypothetical protein BGZ82_005721 [Podila clonocystis]